MTTENQTEDQSQANDNLPPAADTTPAISSDQPFFEYLAAQYTTGDVKQFLRSVKRGIFVHESQTDKVIELYKNWLQENRNPESGKSEEKVRRKLFGDAAAKLYYILDGKNCLPGFLIERNLEQSIQRSIPYSPAGLLDTENYVHPRDPALADIEGVKSSFDQIKGFRFFVETPQQTVQFTTDFLIQFGQVARNVPNLTKEHPELKGPLRATIPILVKLLKGSRGAKENQRFLVPSQYKNHPSELFLLTEAATFVLDKNNSLIGCYGTNRKNLKKLIASELSKEVNIKIPNIRLTFASSWKLGTIKINHLLYTIHQDILCEALLKADRSPRLRKACTGRFTIFNCLTEIANILKEATLVVRAKDESKDKKETVSYLKFQNWNFFLSGKNVISSFEEKLKPKGNSKKGGAKTGEIKSGAAQSPTTPTSTEPTQSPQAKS